MGKGLIGVVVLVLLCVGADGTLLSFPYDFSIESEAFRNVFARSTQRTLIINKYSGTYDWAFCSDDFHDGLKLDFSLYGENMCTQKYKYPPFYDSCGNTAFECQHLFELSNQTGWPATDIGLRCPPVTVDFSVQMNGHESTWKASVDGQCGADKLTYTMVSSDDAPGYLPINYLNEFRSIQQYVGCVAGTVSNSFTNPSFVAPSQSDIEGVLASKCGVNTNPYLPPPTLAQTLALVHGNKFSTFNPQDGTSTLLFKLDNRDVNPFVVFPIKLQALPKANLLFYYGPSYCCDYSRESFNDYGTVDLDTEEYTLYALPSLLFAHVSADSVGVSAEGDAFAIYADYGKSLGQIINLSPGNSTDNYTTVVDLGKATEASALYVSSSHLYMQLDYPPTMVVYDRSSWLNVSQYSLGNYKLRGGVVDGSSNTLYALNEVAQHVEYTFISIDLDTGEQLINDGVRFCGPDATNSYISCTISACSLQLEESLVFSCVVNGGEVHSMDVKTSVIIISKRVGYATAPAYLLN